MFKFVSIPKPMKNKHLLLFLALFIFSSALLAQKRPSYPKKPGKKSEPEQYYSESGIPLRLEEKKDKNGQVIEKNFYRDRGKVKSDTLNEKQLFNNGKLYEARYYTGEGKLSFVSKFDAEGKQSEIIFYEKTGEVHDRNVYTYGTNGTKKSIRYGKGDVIESSQITDEDGRILNTMEFSADGTVLRKEVCQYEGKISACKKRECLKYNGDNILIYKEVFNHETKQREETKYFDSGKIKSYQLSEGAYTASSNMLKWDIYEEDGSYRKQLMKSFKKSKSKYDRGVTAPTEVSYYSADGKLQKKYTHAYDDKGNTLETLSYDANGKLLSTTKHVYKYDANEDVLEEAIYDGNGKLFYTEVYTRNERGRPTEIVRKNADGTTKDIMKDGKRID